MGKSSKRRRSQKRRKKRRVARKPAATQLAVLDPSEAEPGQTEPARDARFGPAARSEAAAESEPESETRTPEARTQVDAPEAPEARTQVDAPEAPAEARTQVDAPDAPDASADRTPEALTPEALTQVDAPAEATTRTEQREPAEAADSAAESPIHPGTRPDSERPPALPPKRRRGAPAADPERPPPPRGGFMKGAVLGFIVVIPALAVAVHLLSRLEVVAPASLERAIAFVAVFAGLPAVLTAGGVGRVAAHAAVAARGGHARSIRDAALAFAAAGVGLVLLVAVPLGGLPEDPARWGWIAVVGAVTGAILGAIIGLWAGYRDTGDTTRDPKAR